MRHKIIYHVGERLFLKAEIESGTLRLEEEGLSISGTRPEGVKIVFSEIRQLELYHLRGLGRFIKLVCTERTLFVAVVRLNLFGYFAMVNFFRTGELFRALKKKLQPTGAGSLDRFHAHERLSPTSPGTRLESEDALFSD